MSSHSYCSRLYDTYLGSVIDVTDAGIDKRIVIMLASQDWPVTTDAVAQVLKISWNTAQLHLYKLQAEGFVRGKRVGRQNEWVLAKSHPS